MVKDSKPRSRTELHVVLAALVLVLFSWPLLTIPEQHHDMSLFKYLFVTWGVVIVLLFLATRDSGGAWNGQQDR